MRTSGRTTASKASLADAVRVCRKAANALVDAAKGARMFADECGRLSKFAKRLQSLLDDLEDNAVDPRAEQAGVQSVAELEAALSRAQAVVHACAVMGPFYALMHEAEVLGEFVNAAIDIHAALKSLDCKALKVVPDLAEDLALTLQQLQRISVSYTQCTSSQQTLTELRNEAEALRVQQPGAKAFPHTDMAQRYLADCTVQQIATDVEYLRRELEAASQARKHVEAFFFQMLLGLEEPLLPKDQKAARAMADQVVVVPSASAEQNQQAQPAEPEMPSDPVPVVHKLLETLVQTNLPVEARAAALQPLVAAAGLAPPLDEVTPMHSGAVLYALTEPSCAQQVVALVNDPGTEPVIKSWLLALVLSLVHPEKGLNPETQRALMATGMPAALCRLVVRTATPDDQRLQCLAMLRVLIHDPATHALMVEAKVINALVQQVGDVLVIKGKVIAPTSAPVQQPPATNRTVRGHSAASDQNSGPAFDVSQQMLELAVLMLADLAPGPYKGEILTSGGVKALTQRMADASSHERVRAAAAGALSILMEDGALAVEAARDDALVHLMAMASSGSQAMKAAANQAIKVMLTPSPPTNSTTANVALSAGPGFAVPPPKGQGKGRAWSDAGSEASFAGGTLGSTAKAGVVKDPKQLTEELFAEMGRAFSPASTSALMQVLALDDKDMTPLALSFLPLTATDPNCRAAIIRAAVGLPVLMREAGAGQPAAVGALRRVAEDLKLKSEVATALGKTLLSAKDTQSQANLALAISSVAGVAPGSERDKAAITSAQAFAGEMHQVGAIPALVALVKSTDTATKTAGVLAVRPLALYGEQAVRDAIVAADALVYLVDASKQEAPVASAPAPTAAAGAAGGGGGTAAPTLGAIAAEALSGLAYNEANQKQVFTSLQGFLTAASTVKVACQALLTVAGDSVDALTKLGESGIIPTLINLISTGPEENMAVVCRLLAALVIASPDSADLAIEKDAAKALPRALEKGDLEAKASAAAAAAFLAKRSDAARTQLAERQAVTLLVELAKTLPPATPLYEEALGALASMACLHEGSRAEASRAIKNMITRGSKAEAEAAALVCVRLSHSPKGREILFSDDLVDPLVRLLSNGTPNAQAYAADGLTHAASCSSVNITPAAGSAAASSATGSVNPRAQLISRGAVDALVRLLKSENETVVFEAAEALDCIASIEEGVKAIKRIRGHEALQEVVQKGKRKEVGERTQKAAYDAYMKVL